MPFRAIHNEPRIAIDDHFLSEAECRDIKALAEPYLKPVKLGGLGGLCCSSFGAPNSEETHIRWEKAKRDPVMSAVMQRMSAQLDVPPSHLESLRVVRYGLNGRFRSHLDSFPFAPPATQGGQRVATLLMYLNTPNRGGATYFTELKLRVPALQGVAVGFWYPKSPNHDLRHCGEPVLSGEKWIAQVLVRANSVPRPTSTAQAR